MQMYNNLVEMIVVLMAVVVSAFFISLLFKWSRETKFEKHLFKFFALRDRLAYLVIDGKLEQDSEVYQFLVYNINRYISSIKDINVYNYILNYIEINSNQNNVETLDKIISKCKNESTEVFLIMKDFEKITYNVIRDNSKIFIVAFIFSAIVLGVFKQIPNFISQLTKAQELAQEQRTRIEQYA